MFKLYALFSLLIIFNCPVFAQQVDYSEEKGDLKKQRFIDNYDYVFNTKNPAKGLFKINLVNSLPITYEIIRYRSILNFQATVGLIYERKLNNSFSLNFSATPLYNNQLDFDLGIESLGEYFALGWSIEPRWYYDMRKRILQNKSASNMSGNYLGLQIGGTWQTNSFNGTDNSFNLDRTNAQLRFGLQRRIFQRAYVDIGVGVGGARDRDYFGSDGEYNHNWELFYGLQVALGMAFGDKINPEPNSKKCDAFRCFVEERSMLKIGLLGLLDGNSSTGFNGRVEAAYEHKIGDTYFSMNYGVYTNYFLTYRINDDLEKDFLTGFGLYLEPRWYYDLKKRIARGKTANNLASNYMTIQLSTDSNPDLFTGADDRKIRYRERSINVIPAWGIQRRIFNNGYFDYKIGLGPTTKGNFSFSTDNVPVSIQRDFFDEVNLLFLSELKVGLAF